MTYIQQTNLSNYQFNVDTANFVKQAISTTVVGYSGTEITYTPTQGSSKVIYEIGFYVEVINQTAFQHIVLEQNTGTWSVVDNKFGKNFGFQALHLNILETTCIIDL